MCWPAAWHVSNQKLPQLFTFPLPSAPAHQPSFLCEDQSLHAANGGNYWGGKGGEGVGGIPSIRKVGLAQREHQTGGHRSFQGWLYGQRPRHSLVLWTRPLWDATQLLPCPVYKADLPTQVSRPGGDTAGNAQTLVLSLLCGHSWDSSLCPQTLLPWAVAGEHLPKPTLPSSPALQSLLSPAWAAVLPSWCSLLRKQILENIQKTIK